MMFLQLVLDTNQANALSTYEMSVPIASDTQLYFCSVALMSREFKRKMLNPFRKAIENSMSRKAVLLARKSCDAYLFWFA